MAELASSMERAHGAGTRAGQLHQEAACIFSSPGGGHTAVGSFLKALPGRHMTMNDDMLVAAIPVWHRLSILVPTGMPSAPCQCSSGENVGADDAMVCKNVARIARYRMAQMRHDTMVEALRLVMSHTSLQSAQYPWFCTVPGGKCMENGRRCGIVAVMQRLTLQLATVDGVVSHAPVPLYAAAAAQDAGKIAARVEDQRQSGE